MEKDNKVPVWDLFWSTRAKRNLLSSISGHLITVTQLLRTSQPLSLQRQLCCIVSNTCQIVGAIYLDMNQAGMAEAYHTLAVEAAHEVANDPLEALALGRLGILYIQRGAYSDSLPFGGKFYVSYFTFIMCISR